MAKFITIGYGDEAGYDRTAAAVRDAAHAHDASMRAGGALIGVAGTPVQVRNHDAAGVQTTAGPFLRSDLPIAGFAVIDATSLQEAIALVSKTPCAVAHGVVEVWPLQDMP
ncbi:MULTISPECIES: YciI family protein [unclassified Rhizobacter]|uniref:YciI family protein n=1 Tax=unclassified Rhizobacter TaxID=2640088 RepID=UPI0006F69F53|nr:MULTISPECIES: YciI family protein [unclassified Rhizobacter]KQU81040.1 transcription initiation protein [Rhizobacter sp. Root29]KQW04584.1 transcription initiation protein [Rhizobacter sp. Root1238]KRB06427.1 transcription initiation protein [Rhizobacter sp. Root16D2]